MADRSVLAHPLFTGISTAHLSSLIAELARPWVVGIEGRRHQARVGARQRAPGAGARHQLVFVDRLVATLIHLRHDLPHAVLALLLYEVDRSAVTRAVGEVRRLLAVRGFAVADRPGVRLRTLEDVFACAQAEGVRLRLDATEVQVRRRAAGRGGRRAFVSGKKKQNTMRPALSPTTRAAPCGPTLYGQGVCTTRPPGRPASADASTTSTWSGSSSMTATSALAETTAGRPSPHHANCDQEP